MLTPAAAYLRVSGKSQLDGDGLPRQKQLIESFADTHGLTLGSVQEDEAVSGTLPWHQRPGLMEILKLPPGTTVLIERVDRLSRDLLVGELILQEFRAKGLKCIAVDSGLELTEVDVDPSVTLIRQILMALAQYDKSAIVRKLKHGRAAVKAKTGRCEGGKPFGMLDGEVATLQWLLQLRRERRKFLNIAVLLNANGHTTRAGHPWTAERVRRVYRTWKRGQKCQTSTT